VALSLSAAKQGGRAKLAQLTHNWPALRAHVTAAPESGRPRWGMKGSALRLAALGHQKMHG